MRKLLPLLLALTILPSTGWTGDLGVSLPGQPDKTSSLSLDKNARTGIWVATCSISIEGVDLQQAYFGVMIFQAPTGDVTRSEFVFSVADRSIKESSPGIYTFEGKLAGRRITMKGTYVLSEVRNGNTIECTASVQNGPTDAFPPVYQPRMLVVVQGGEP